MTVAKEIFYDWAGMNVWLFKKINALSGQHEWYDALMVMISNIAQSRLFGYYYAFIFLICLISIGLYALKEKPGLKHYQGRWAGVLIMLALGFAVVVGINHELKDYFSYPRPYMVLAPEDISVLEVRDGDIHYRSFPSGHMAFITLLVFCLWPVLGERLRSLASLLVPLEGWSRIAVGVHFPADVIISFLLTTIILVILRTIVHTVLYGMLKVRC